MAERVRRMPSEPACFALVAAVYIAYFLAKGYGRFYHDSLEYWSLGDRFQDDHGFSLLAYTSPYRGYSLPLFNRGLAVVASALGLSDVRVVELTGALLAATLGVVVLPRLAHALFPGAAVGWSRVLALNGLVFVFWRDHFNFPLTDFPALLLAALGLLGLFQRRPAGYLAAGLCFGLAANMRPAYIPAALAVFLVAALLPLRPWSWRHRASAATLVAVGGVVVSLPQMAINHHQAGTWSPTLRGSRDVSMVQLSAGLVAQRYETYIGPKTRYPRIKVFYIDPAGLRALRAEGIGEVTSYGQYARIVAHRPDWMAASYALHLFNGLDVWYPTPYVRDLRNRSNVLSLLNYTLLFLAVARLAVRETRRRLGPIIWAGLVILLLPAVNAIPGAIEPRFFLPVYLLVYMLVCFSPDWRGSLLAVTAARRFALASCCAVFIIGCVTLSAATRSQIEYPAATSALTKQPLLPMKSRQRERDVPRTEPIVAVA